eukprot:TRINITY_DN1024_c0_g1_i1.p2 TRINITY_DN1024_c0_g1~~TRINITY_DN1024_c0_g1_i1.p2  ORF type:complete len:946 (+),score=301.79 TRINITY_DN1024_c0_g1_i1:160-2997(+)
MPLNEADFARLQSELIHLKQDNYEFKSQIAKGKTETEKVNKELVNVRKELESEQKKYTALEKELVKAKEAAASAKKPPQVAHLQQELDERTQLVDALKENMRQVLETNAEVQKEMEELRAQARAATEAAAAASASPHIEQEAVIAQLRSEVLQLTADKSTLQEQLRAKNAAPPPPAVHSVDPHTVEELKKAQAESEAAQKKLADSKGKLRDAEAALVTAHAEIDTLKQQLAADKSRQTQLEEQLAALTKSMGDAMKSNSSDADSAEKLTELTVENQRLVAKVNALEGEVHSKQEQHAADRETLAKSEAALKETRERVDVLTEQTAKDGKRIADLQAQFDGVSQKMLLMVQESSQAEEETLAKTMELTIEKQQLNGKISALESELAALKQQLSSSNDALSALQQMSTQQAQELTTDKEKLTSCETQVASLQTQLNDQQAENESLAGAVAEQRANMSSLEESRAALEQKLSEAMADNQELLVQLKGAESDAAANAKQLEESQQNLSAVNETMAHQIQEIVELKEQLFSASSKVTQLEKHLADQVSEIERLESVVAEQRDNMLKLDELCTENDQKNAELTSQKENLQAELESVREQLASTEDKLRVLHSEFNETQHAKAALEKLHRALATECDSEKKAKQTAQAKVQELQKENSTMEKHVARLEEVAANVATMRSLLAGTQDDLATSQNHLHAERRAHQQANKVCCALVRKLGQTRTQTVGLALVAQRLVARNDALNIDCNALRTDVWAANESQREAESNAKTLATDIVHQRETLEAEHQIALKKSKQTILELKGQLARRMSTADGETVLDAEDSKALMAKMSEKQEKIWQLEQRVSMLQGQSAEIQEDNERKDVIIKHYIMRERLGTLLPEPKKETGAKGIFGKVLSKIGGDTTEHDVAAKSQRVLEDCLIRNIQLQNDLANIGEEVARLQMENRDMKAHLGKQSLL